MSRLGQLSEQWVFAEAVARSTGRDDHAMDAIAAWREYRTALADAIERKSADRRRKEQ